MKIIRSSDLEFVPASHEHTKSPGVLKKILLYNEDIMNGDVQMINWALLPAGRSFQAHYHEDMEEIFIILKGRVKIIIDGEEAILETGDTVVVPMMCVHTMDNAEFEDVEYIVVGVSLGRNGKTMVV
ncbi:MAG: cupin domain-containing protein [Thermodesulfobacteriota bacterium]|nr:cupin domain-containing protein [Thermodesulfobacteriota bacterium]